ncbi:hypothetical protein [Evansella clarkii]|uniref:hypothetical protein n=1 Tax=Evansella clarkii TaxID=79879 RepID=UPI000B444831|nr:hypothetical protein [Evansella clarkii]
MLYLLLFTIVAAALFGVYYINIGLAKVQLEELVHRLTQDEITHRDLDEWEFNMEKLFGKPFGTKTPILHYGEYYESFINRTVPSYESKTLEKYRKFKAKQKV